MATPFDLTTALEQRKADHLYRQRMVLESPQTTRVKVDGRDYLAFCSNDYLGLANHPEVIDAFQLALKQYGVGSGASHLVIGHSQPHHQLEEDLAEFTGRDRALLFSTGYMANMGVINGLLNKRDTVLQDKLNHASLLDGGLLSGARFQRYLHNDIYSLEKKLEKVSDGRCLVVTDGVFSMDGDKAPLTPIAELCTKHNAWLMVDDAHGFGCLGSTGAGILEELNLSQQQVPILMGTLGKALGVAGAFVAGSEALIETLIQSARSYIYTTGMPPAQAAAISKGLQLLSKEAWRREKLQSLVEHFRVGAEAAGLQLMDSKTAIQPIVVGAAEQALDLSARLKEKGILVTAIRPPTVPKNTSRLRVTLSADHEKEDIDLLLTALSEATKESQRN